MVALARQVTTFVKVDQCVSCASRHNVEWSLFMEPRHLIGTAEAARLLSVSHRTIHRLVEAGELIPVMTAPGGINGAFLFQPVDVERIRDLRAEVKTA